MLTYFEENERLKEKISPSCFGYSTNVPNDKRRQELVAIVKSALGLKENRKNHYCIRLITWLACRGDEEY